MVIAASVAVLAAPAIAEYGATYGWGKIGTSMTINVTTEGAVQTLGEEFDPVDLGFAAMSGTLSPGISQYSTLSRSP